MPGESVRGSVGDGDGEGGRGSDDCGSEVRKNENENDACGEKGESVNAGGGEVGSESGCAREVSGNDDADDGGRVSESACCLTW